MATYLVDLENTGLAGLSGLDELSAKDKVIVFYGTRTGSIAFDKHVELTKAKADVTYTKTERVAKNYLDFQLVTYLGYLIGSGQERVYYIISKDKGYDSCIEFWRKTDKQITITRCESLQKQKITARAGVTANEQPEAQKNPAAEAAEAEQSAGGGKQTEQAVQTAAGKKASAPKASGRPALPESMRKKIRKAVKDENLKGGSYARLYDYVVRFSDKHELNVALVKDFRQEKGNRLYKEILEVFVEYQKQKPVSAVTEAEKRSGQ